MCEETPVTWYPKFGHKCNADGTGEDPVEFWLGWLASASCIGLFMSPIPQVMMKIVKNKTTGQFPDMPYLVSLTNCTLWVMYALPQKLTQCFAINALGLVLNSLWLIIFLMYTERRAALIAKIVAVFAVILAVFAAGAIVKATSGDEATANSIVGDVADIFNIGMYGAPLAAVGTVVQTRSVETLPILMVLGCLLASIMWGTYGKWIGDYHVGIPNDIGVVLGMVQVIVWLKYRNATPTDMHAKLADGGAKVADASQA